MSEDQTKQTPKHEMGLYCKFIVKRTDGSSEPGGKHYGCDYFTLDLTHDPYASCALKAYADACENEYPKLARDLRKRIEGMRNECIQAKLDRVTELVGGLRAAALAAESLSHTAYAQDYQRGLSHAYASSADDLEQALKEVEK